jgi:thymidine kinase
MPYLEIIFGPMFSGKTSKLIDLYNKYKTYNTVFAINYDKDTRYSTNKIVSHDGKEINAKFINKFEDLNELDFTINRLESAEYIFINEAQFFPNLKSWVLNQIEKNNKNVVLCGLDCDYKRNKFGEILDLVPYANTITKLNGTCTKCGKPSMFTHRISNEIEQEVIGCDNYIPVCRFCYIILNNQK